jgi:hypothetical protein
MQGTEVKVFNVQYNGYFNNGKSKGRNGKGRRSAREKCTKSGGEGKKRCLP